MDTRPYKKLAGPKPTETSRNAGIFAGATCAGGLFTILAKTKAPTAVETLRRIAALYEIEARVRGKSGPADRLAVRQEPRAKPLVRGIAHLVRSADRETACSQPNLPTRSAMR